MILADHEWEYIKQNSISDFISGKNSYFFKPKSEELFTICNYKETDFVIGPQRVEETFIKSMPNHTVFWERDKNLALKEKAKMMKEMVE